MLTFERVLREFKEDFNKVKNKKVKTNRRGNTGIGKTFEDVLGIVENNNIPIDYKGFIELKSQRQYTGSMLTLFTKSPNPYGIMPIIRDQYGELDPRYGKTRIIHTTVKHSAYNIYKGKTCFKLNLNRKSGRLELLIKDLLTGQPLMKHNSCVYWELDDLKKIVETKCRNIAYISGKSEQVNGEEYFTFTKAILLTGLTFDSFLDHLERDIIMFDIRNGTHSDGTPHDHGPAFRIQKNHIKLAFKQDLL